MNISWAIGDSVKIAYQSQLWDIKAIGPTWGSWRTWRYTNTDNVVCSDRVRASELIESRFYQHCNLYLPQQIRENTMWPREIREFGGEFPHSQSDNDEAIALALVGSISDVVLVMGYDWTRSGWADRSDYYRGFVTHTLSTSKCQWVIVDTDCVRDITEIPSVECDTLERVIQLMKIQ